MALQQDPSKSFDSSSYFKNKDQQRQQVNAMRQSERQKRITTQLLRRNMKQAMRRGEDGGRFIQAAEAADLDIFGRTGLGEEASVAMERARYDADQNFNAAQRAKSQRDAKLGEAGAKPDGKVNPVDGKATTPTDGKTTSATGSATAPDASVPPVTSELSREDQIKALRPDWADEVKNDRTFKVLNFEDPLTLESIKGKSRGEVYDMLRKQQAAKLMAEYDDRGKTLALGEENILSQRKYAANIAAEKEMKIKQGFENFAKEQAFAQTPEGIRQNDLKKFNDAERTLYAANLASKKPEFEKFEKYVKDPNSAPNSTYASDQLAAYNKLVGKVNNIDANYEADTTKRKQATLDSQVSYEKFKEKWDEFNSSDDAEKINKGYKTYKQERAVDELKQKDIEAKKLKKEMEAKESRELREQIEESYQY